MSSTAVSFFLAESSRIRCQLQETVRLLKRHAIPPPIQKASVPLTGQGIQSAAASHSGLELKICVGQKSRSCLLPGLDPANIIVLSTTGDGSLTAVVTQDSAKDSFKVKIFSTSASPAVLCEERANTGMNIAAFHNKVIWLERDERQIPVRAMSYGPDRNLATVHDPRKTDTRLALSAVTSEAILLSDHTDSKVSHFLIRSIRGGDLNTVPLPDFTGARYSVHAGTVWALLTIEQSILMWDHQQQKFSEQSFSLPRGFHATDLGTQRGTMFLVGRRDGGLAIWLPSLGSDAVWQAPPAGVIRFRGLDSHVPYFVVSSPSIPPQITKGLPRGGWPTKVNKKDKVTCEVVRQIPDAALGVSVTMFAREDLKQPPSSRPLLAIVYGSYGVPNEGSFDPTISALMMEGITIAFCHVRGGGEHGRQWHEEGKGVKKRNSLIDFKAILSHLSRGGYCSPSLLAVSGASAGGLLAARAAIDTPEAIRAVYLNRPFLAPEIELDQGINGTVFEEWREFGTPSNGNDAYATYSPFSRLKSVAPGKRPPVWITVGTSDLKSPLSTALTWAEGYSKLAGEGKVIVQSEDSGHSPLHKAGPNWESAAWLLEQLKDAKAPSPL